MTFTVTAFDTLMLLADAIERARIDNPQNLNFQDVSELKKFRQAVRDALSETRDYKGVSGRITFKASRDPRKPLVLLHIRNGKFRFLQKVTPE